MLRASWRRLKRSHSFQRPIVLSLSHQRSVHSSPSQDERLLAELLRNPELSKEDACNELRWIKQHVIETLIPREDITGDVQSLVRRRSLGEPLQYILGSTDFGPLIIECRPPVLIPRPETAYMVTRLAKIYTSLSSHSGLNAFRLNVADLCSGSGCIALLLAHLIPQANVRGFDISPQAVALANDNTRRLNLDQRVSSTRLDIFSSSALEAMTASGRYHLIVANPPYIAPAEWGSLPASVREWEDSKALIGTRESDMDAKGLSYFERLAAMLPELLNREASVSAEIPATLPQIAVEIGIGQGLDVEAILKRSERITRTEIWSDQYERERMVVGWGG